MLYQLSYFRNFRFRFKLSTSCFPIADAKVVLFSKLPKVFYTFYSTFITLFQQFPHNQYKPKESFFLVIKTYGHGNPHSGSLYILPRYGLYAK